MPVTVSLARVNWALGVIFVALTLLGLASEILLSVYHEEWAYGLVPLLNLSYETNIPTWYSSVLLLACATVLAAIARLTNARRARHARHWAVMAAIFLYMSIDEAVQIHEMINPALTDTYHLSGVLTFSWVIPFGILVALFVLAYIGFLRHLSRRFRVWFVVAGALYVGGALGTELPISWWYDRHGGDNLVYGLANLAQESLEILGATVFLAALLAYIGAEIGELRIRLLDVSAPDRPDEAVVPEMHQ
jgi:hypothetical protein